MATQPEINDASEPGAEFLARLRKGTDNERLQQWPGTEGPEGQFYLVPLLCDELQDAYAAAWARLKTLELQMNAYNSDEFFAELAIQILALSMHKAQRDAEGVASRGPRMFKSADGLRSKLRPGEREAIAALYQSLQDAVDPDPDRMDAAAFDKIEELSRKKDVTRLSGLPSRTLASYIIGMESLLASSPGGKLPS